MLVLLPIFIGVLAWRWNAKFDALLTSKVSSDLTIADQYMSQMLLRQRDAISAISESAVTRDALATPNDGSDRMSQLLRKAAPEHGFDFLYAVDESGGLIASSTSIRGSVRFDWPIVLAAIRGTAQVGIDVFDPASLAAISHDLSDRARIRLEPQPGQPAALREERRGLVVHAAAPLLLPSGKKGALVAGTLLNQNAKFIDSISNLVYGGRAGRDGAGGAATLFLDDVRVSTSVRVDGVRALGTRASDEVARAVIGKGETWLDDAFVINSWYISGYRPLVDSRGARIGMLYVGFAQEPYAQARRNTAILMIIAFVVVAGITVPIFLYWARGIFKPLERMADTIERMEHGDMAARTGHVDARDEIGLVANHLDGLLKQLDERDAQLRQWNNELNRRVDERTQNLVAANQQLEETTKQLIMSEKLATIGEITAGVAHEINNPLAVMQGNLEVVRDLMGNRAERADVEFKLLDEQIHRIGTIVSKLLQFSRPAEYAGYLEEQNASDIVLDTLPLVDHVLKKTVIVVERQLGATRMVTVNKTELQQVLVNLIINAIHAMPNGGRLVLRTLDAESTVGDPGVAIQVADNGSGIPPEVVARIFDPFFTTKKQAGTGLGLSISQMLISRQGGHLSVASGFGKGTTFTVWLPEAQ